MNEWCTSHIYIACVEMGLVMLLVLVLLLSLWILPSHIRTYSDTLFSLISFCLLLPHSLPRLHSFSLFLLFSLSHHRYKRFTRYRVCMWIFVSICIYILFCVCFRSYISIHMSISLYMCVWPSQPYYVLQSLSDEANIRIYEICL